MSCRNNKKCPSIGPILRQITKVRDEVSRLGDVDKKINRVCLHAIDSLNSLIVTVKPNADLVDEVENIKDVMREELFCIQRDQEATGGEILCYLAGIEAAIRGG